MINIYIQYTTSHPFFSGLDIIKSFTRFPPNAIRFFFYSFLCFTVNVSDVHLYTAKIIPVSDGRRRVRIIINLNAAHVHIFLSTPTTHVCWMLAFMSPSPLFNV